MPPDGRLLLEPSWPGRLPSCFRHVNADWLAAGYLVRRLRPTLELGPGAEVAALLLLHRWMMSKALRQAMADEQAAGTSSSAGVGGVAAEDGGDRPSITTIDISSSRRRRHSVLWHELQPSARKLSAVSMETTAGAAGGDGDESTTTVVAAAAAAAAAAMAAVSVPAAIPTDSSAAGGEVTSSGPHRQPDMLRQVACACLLIGGKLHDQRRLMSDLARGALTERGVAGSSQPSSTLANAIPGDGVLNSRGQETLRHLRHRWRGWESQESGFITKIERLELDVLVSVGFMVVACTESPMAYALSLHRALFGGEKEGRSESWSEQRELLQGTITLIGDLLTLPVCGVVATAQEVAVAAYVYTLGHRVFSSSATQRSDEGQLLLAACLDKFCSLLNIEAGSQPRRRVEKALAFAGWAASVAIPVPPKGQDVIEQSPSAAVPESRLHGQFTR